MHLVLADQLSTMTPSEHSLPRLLVNFQKRMIFRFHG